MLINSRLLALPITLLGLWTAHLALPAGTDAGQLSRPRAEGDESAAPAVFHPHFPKMLECKISKELTLTVRYQTVTFDAEGAEKMKPGAAWHLAGATLETSAKVKIGGQEVPAGNYALSVRKTEEAWELTLHEGRGFSTDLGDSPFVLETAFVSDAPLLEHMNIDVHPVGTKEEPRVSLEVHFDKLKASALIEELKD